MVPWDKQEDLMDFKQKIIGATAIGACAVLAIAAFALWPRGDTEGVAKELAGSSATATSAANTADAAATGEGEAVASIESTPISGDESAGESAGETDENSVDSIYTGPAGDMRAHYTAAAAAVLAYTTVSPDETVEARSARLAQHFAPGSELLTNEPDLVNPRGFNDMTTTIVTRGIPMAGFDSEAGGVYTIKVLLDYTATYVQSGRPMEVLATGVWFVTMSTTFDGVVLSVEEPDGR